MQPKTWLNLSYLVGCHDKSFLVSLSSFQWVILDSVSVLGHSNLEHDNKNWANNIRVQLEMFVN